MSWNDSQGAASGHEPYCESGQFGAQDGGGMSGEIIALEALLVSAMSDSPAMVSKDNKASFIFVILLRRTLVAPAGT